MKDARWLDVLDAVQASALHFQTAERLFRAGGFEAAGDDGYRNRTSFLYAMMSGHTAFEDAILRLLDIVEEEAPSGSDWHTKLIDRVGRPVPERRPAVLDAQLAAAARETRSFRHLIVHGYRIELRPQRAQPALEGGVLLADRLEEAIRAFANAVDPD